MSRTHPSSLGVIQWLGVIGVAAVACSPFAIRPRDAFALPVTLTSTVAQSGYNNTIGTGPAPVTATGGYDFTGQSFANLTSIQSISVTLSLFDLDSATGNLDFNKLTLGLDGINTGIRLNGFPDSALLTQTITDVPRDPVTGLPSTAVADAIITALKADGRLTGSIFSTDHPSFNGFQAPATANTTLSITGEATTGGGGGGDGGGDGGGGTGNWTLTLTNASQSGQAGSTVFFNGAITNGTGGDLFIDTASLDFNANAPASSYEFDLDPRFVDTLGIIPTSGYVGPLFFVQWLPTAPIGTTGDGTFEVDVAGPGDPTSRSVTFSAQVVAPNAAVPQPMTLLLVMAPVIAVAAARIGQSRHHRRG